MPIENMNTNSDNSLKSSWDELREYGEKNPFPNKNIKNMQTDINDEAEFLSKKQKIKEVIKKNAEIYDPSDEKVQRNIEYCLESVKANSEALYDIGSSMENKKVTKEGISELVGFFGENFGVEVLPKIIFVTDENSKFAGYYHGSKKELGIKVNGKESLAEIIETVAHEMWHAHQYCFCAIEKAYKINFENYCNYEEDFDMYNRQLVEKEAFTIGDMIGDIYRKMDLAKNPEKMPVLQRKYREWSTGEYNPSESKDGLDYKYLIMAHDDFKKNTIFDRVKKNFIKRRSK